MGASNKGPASEAKGLPNPGPFLAVLLYDQARIGSGLDE